jgi:PIN domain nuclease of toxin-antitoxin system
MSRVLLDTHVLLWAMYRPERLPQDIAEIIRDRSNDVLFSAISILEVAIKTALRRPDFNIVPTEVISDAMAVGFVELPVWSAAAAIVSTLPPIHKDPFDRLLVAQAMHEPAILLTADHALDGYTPLVRRFVAKG